MTGHRDDWELLNGHADGELEPEDAEALQQRLAADPTLAAGLAQIMALKTSLSALRPLPEPSATARPAAEASAAVQPTVRHGYIAAAAILLVLTAGIGYGLFGAGASGMAGPGEIHRAFSERTYFVDPDREVLVSAGTPIGDLQAPDLSASNLALVDMQTFAATARIAFHYRGRRGCRVTLIVDTSESAPFRSVGSAALIHLWQTRTRRFALIAEGMDETRFAAIGDFAEAQSRASERQRELRTALVEQTEAARPCA